MDSATDRPSLLCPSTDGGMACRPLPIPTSALPHAIKVPQAMKSDKKSLGSEKNPENATRMIDDIHQLKGIKLKGIIYGGHIPYRHPTLPVPTIPLAVTNVACSVGSPAEYKSLYPMRSSSPSLANKRGIALQRSWLQRPGNPPGWCRE